MKDPAVRTRVLMLAAILALAFGGLTARLGWLMVVKHGELAQIAERQYSRTVVLYAPRGPIVDRQGGALATSTATESLFVQPRSVGDPVRVAARLAPILGQPASEVHAALTGTRSFVWLRRKLPPTVAEQVRALREPGLGFLPEPLRLYPNRELAAHVLGFEGAEGGLEGVERAFNADLAGVPGKAIAGRDALGREVAAQHVLQQPQPGHGVMLTIDRTIQYIAEREIDAAYRRTHAKAAIAVVLEPRTGDILAMAVRPTFNPNTFLDVASSDAWRNRAVTDPFEPGSTFKAILAASALEEGVVRPDDRIYAENGSITLAGTTIRDWKKYGWLSFAEVLQNSSNVGSIKVGLSLGRDRYYRYMKAFGFGAPTGVGLAGESRGLLRDPQRWSLLSLPTMSIGQEISVTALQLVAAFGTIANGGTLMQPRLVKSTFDADGRETRRFDAKAVRQVAYALETLDERRRVGHRTLRGDSGLRRRRQDRDGPEARPGDQALFARTGRPVVRRVRAVGRAALRLAGDARRASEREMGQRGGGADLRRDRPGDPPLPRGAAARCPAGPDRHGSARRAGDSRPHAARQHGGGRSTGRGEADARPRRQDLAPGPRSPRAASGRGAPGRAGPRLSPGPGRGRPARAGRCRSSHADRVGGDQVIWRARP